MPRSSRSPGPSAALVAATPARAEPARTVLLATADPLLADRLAGLVATAGLTPERLADLATLARPERPGSEVSLVLVGADAAAVATDQRLRHGAVVVVGVAPVPAEVWRGAVRLGAEHVAVLPEAEPWLVERLLDAADIGPRAPVLAVIGGRGGAGASTLAVALCVTAAQSARRPVLVDLDRYGGGADLLLAAEDEPGLRWDDLADTRGRMRTGVLRSALPCAGGVHFLTWQRGIDLDPSAAAAGAVVKAAARDFDLVLLDLPRHLDEVARAGLRGADRTLLLVPAEVRAAAAAGRLLATLEALTGDVRLVVRGPAPTGLPATSLADALDLPLAGDLRPEPGLAAALDRGLVPPARSRGPLAVWCRRLVRDLGVG